MPRPPLQFSPEQLLSFVAQAAADFRAGLGDGKHSLSVTPRTAAALAPLRRVFHGLVGVMPTLGRLELGYLARTGEALVLLLPEHPALAPLVEEVLAQVESLVAELEGPAGDAPTGEPTIAPKGEGLTVLVVDDDRASALLVEASLAPLGLRVLLCNAPEAALEVLELERPDLTILDVLMPGVDGFELCRRIRLRSSQRYMPILFLSAATATEERVRGLSVGGDDFLPKPFAPSELAARVGAHLQRVATLRELSIRDALTQLYNRGYFDERLSHELRRSRRTKEPFTLALLDLDFFKKVNDQHGHQAGDAVLAHVAQVLLRQFRSSDLAFRFGGEEFAVLLVGASAEAAQATLERAALQVAASPLRYTPAAGGPQLGLSVTVSVGLAAAREDDSVEGLISRADRALYAAKAGGRNRVVRDGPGAGSPP